MGKKVQWDLNNTDEILDIIGEDLISIVRDQDDYIICIIFNSYNNKIIQIYRGYIVFRDLQDDLFAISP